MPKKIKKEKELKLKNSDEKLIRVDNIHYIVIFVSIVLVIICACVGGYVYSKDRYHKHAAVAIAKFTYTEKVDGGYNIYEVSLDENNEVYTYYTTPESSKEKKWSHGKYLDFNEELYNSGIFDNIKDVEIQKSGAEIQWSIEATLVTDSNVYITSNSVKQPDKTEFAKIIKKYFNQEILYK